MEQFLVFMFAIIGVWATLVKLNQWIDGMMKPKEKEIVVVEKVVDKIKEKPKVVGSSNYPIDLEYDKLISNIVRDGKDIGISEHWLTFEYQNKFYEIWIANKDCAYGNHLKHRLTDLAKNRGITQETAEALYEKELAYIQIYGRVKTAKEIEDEFIKSMLSGLEESNES